MLSNWTGPNFCFLAELTTLMRQTFKNILEKGESSCTQDFLFFPQCFLLFRKLQLICVKLRILAVYAFYCKMSLTLSQTSPVFYVCSTSLLKTLWEKEKLLVTSNFSFSHSVFYSFQTLSAIFSKFEIVVRKHFQFGRA